MDMTDLYAAMILAILAGGSDVGVFTCAKGFASRSVSGSPRSIITNLLMRSETCRTFDQDHNSQGMIRGLSVENINERTCEFRNISDQSVWPARSFVPVGLLV